jgi:hypothetical protein
MSFVPTKSPKPRREPRSAREQADHRQVEDELQDSSSRVGEVGGRDTRPPDNDNERSATDDNTREQPESSVNEIEHEVEIFS